MKRITLAVLLTTSIGLLISCKQSTSNDKSGNPLIGQWKIDSITGDSNDFGMLLLTMSLKENADYDMAFTEDSVLFQQKDTVTKTAYTFNASQQQLLLKEDSTFLIYQQLDSTHIKLTDKDSSILFLRKR